MERANYIILLISTSLLFLVLKGAEVDGCSDSGGRKGGQKLFVFGDSYADTGNLGKLGRSLTRAWYSPYGATFPRRPTGRYSDGRLLTDYFASYLRSKSPVPYKYRRSGARLISYGMNFAVAGTGVFDTGNLQRNLTEQINDFEWQIKEGVFSDCDIKSSIALVSIAGNDYTHYMENGGTMVGVLGFMDCLIDQLKLDLKRIHDIGVRKVVVTNLHPLGCTPSITRNSNYNQCDSMLNLGAVAHNAKLKEALNELQGARSDFLSLDLYAAFTSVINQDKGARKFRNTLKPCCVGKGNDTICGAISELGVKQYTVCRNPQDYFYWDMVHPTQAAWATVFEFVKPSLQKFLQ